MLARVLEPEFMDSLDDALDYDAMPHDAVNLAFIEDFLSAIGPLLPEDEFAQPIGILDLGTGTAQIPVELCLREDRVQVMGIDMSMNMLYIGRNRVEIAGLNGRVLLDRVDAKELPYPDAYFHAVMSNSIVHHLPEPEVAFTAASRVARPGGWLFFRDLLRPQDDAEVTRLLELYAADGADHARQLFEDSLRAALTLAEVQDIVAGLGYDRASVQQTSDRHWTWSASKF